MNEVFEFLKKAGVFYLATVEGDQPRVRPFGAINIFENKLYIQTGKIKNVSKQMQVNPKVEICAFTEGKWLRVAATVVRDDRREAKVSMLDANPSLKGMYSADDDNTEVLFLKNATATFSSFTAARSISSLRSSSRSTLSFFHGFCGVSRSHTSSSRAAFRMRAASATWPLCTGLNVPPKMPVRIFLFRSQPAMPL